MGKKVERFAYAAIEQALESVGLVKFTKLFEEVANDIGALEDDLDFASEKREQQFRDGIAKIIKARKGAERDGRAEDREDCDCDRNEMCHRCESVAIPSELSLMVHPEKRIKESVADFFVRMRHWTGLHISSSSSVPLADLMRVDFNVKKLTKKLRKCQSVDELATLLTKKAGCRVMLRESPRGKLLSGTVRLTASSAAYVICLA